MELSTILSLLSLVIGAFASLYAIKTNRDKARLAFVVETWLLNIASCVQDAEDNARLAHKNIEATRRGLNRLPHAGEMMQSTLDNVAWVEADITAVHRLLKRIRHEMKLFEGGLFVGNPVQVTGKSSDDLGKSHEIDREN